MRRADGDDARQWMLAVPLPGDQAAVTVADGNGVGAQAPALPLQIVGLALIERPGVQARRCRLDREARLQAARSAAPGLA